MECAWERVGFGLYSFGCNRQPSMVQLDQTLHEKPILFVLNEQGKAHLKKLGELILLLLFFFC